MGDARYYLGTLSGEVSGTWSFSNTFQIFKNPSKRRWLFEIHKVQEGDRYFESDKYITVLDMTASGDMLRQLEERGIFDHISKKSRSVVVEMLFSDDNEGIVSVMEYLPELPEQLRGEWFDLAVNSQSTYGGLINRSSFAFLLTGIGEGNKEILTPEEVSELMASFWIFNFAENEEIFRNVLENPGLRSLLDRLPEGAFINVLLFLVSVASEISIEQAVGIIGWFIENNAPLETYAGREESFEYYVNKEALSPSLLKGKNNGLITDLSIRKDISDFAALSREPSQAFDVLVAQLFKEGKGDLSAEQIREVIQVLKNNVEIFHELKGVISLSKLVNYVVAAVKFGRAGEFGISDEAQLVEALKILGDKAGAKLMYDFSSIRERDDRAFFSKPLFEAMANTDGITDDLAEEIIDQLHGRVLMRIYGDDYPESSAEYEDVGITVKDGHYYLKGTAESISIVEANSILREENHRRFQAVFEQLGEAVAKTLLETDISRSIDADKLKLRVSAEKIITLAESGGVNFFDPIIERLGKSRKMEKDTIDRFISNIVHYKGEKELFEKLIDPEFVDKLAEYPRIAKKYIEDMHYMINVSSEQRLGIVADTFEILQNADLAENIDRISPEAILYFRGELGKYIITEKMEEFWTLMNSMENDSDKKVLLDNLPYIPIEFLSIFLNEETMAFAGDAPVRFADNIRALSARYRSSGRKREKPISLEQQSQGATLLSKSGIALAAYLELLEKKDREDFLFSEQEMRVIDELGERSVSAFMRGLLDSEGFTDSLIYRTLTTQSTALKALDGIDDRIVSIVINKAYHNSDLAEFMFPEESLALYQEQLNSDSEEVRDLAAERITLIEQNREAMNGFRDVLEKLGESVLEVENPYHYFGQNGIQEVLLVLAASQHEDVALLLLKLISFNLAVLDNIMKVDEAGEYVLVKNLTILEELGLLEFAEQIIVNPVAVELFEINKFVEELRNKNPALLNNLKVTVSLYGEATEDGRVGMRKALESEEFYGLSTPEVVFYLYNYWKHPEATGLALKHGQLNSYLVECIEEALDTNRERTIEALEFRMELDDPEMEKIYTRDVVEQLGKIYGDELLRLARGEKSVEDVRRERVQMITENEEERQKFENTLNEDFDRFLDGQVETERAGMVMDDRLYDQLRRGEKEGLHIALISGSTRNPIGRLFGRGDYGVNDIDGVLRGMSVTPADLASVTGGNQELVRKIMDNIESPVEFPAFDGTLDELIERFDRISPSAIRVRRFQTMLSNPEIRRIFQEEFAEGRFEDIFADGEVSLEEMEKLVLETTSREFLLLKDLELLLMNMTAAKLSRANLEDVRGDSAAVTRGDVNVNAVEVRIDEDGKLRVFDPELGLLSMKTGKLRISTSSQSVYEKNRPVNTMVWSAGDNALADYLRIWRTVVQFNLTLDPIDQKIIESGIKILELTDVITMERKLETNAQKILKYIGEEGLVSKDVQRFISKLGGILESSGSGKLLQMVNDKLGEDIQELYKRNAIYSELTPKERLEFAMSDGEMELTSIVLHGTPKTREEVGVGDVKLEVGDINVVDMIKNGGMKSSKDLDKKVGSYAEAYGSGIYFTNAFSVADSYMKGGSQQGGMILLDRSVADDMIARTEEQGSQPAFSFSTGSSFVISADPDNLESEIRVPFSKVRRIYLAGATYNTTVAKWENMLEQKRAEIRRRAGNVEDEIEKYIQSIFGEGRGFHDVIKNIYALPLQIPTKKTILLDVEQAAMMQSPALSNLVKLAKVKFGIGEERIQEVLDGVTLPKAELVTAPAAGIHAGFGIAMKGDAWASEEAVDARKKAIESQVAKGIIPEKEGFVKGTMLINRQRSDIFIHKDVMDRLLAVDITPQQLIKNSIKIRGPTYESELLRKLARKPLIIDSLERSPNLFGNCQDDGYIYINKNAPIELLQIGISHKLMHTAGIFTDSDADEAKLAQQDLMLMRNEAIDVDVIVENLGDIAEKTKVLLEATIETYLFDSVLAKQHLMETLGADISVERFREIVNELKDANLELREFNRRVASQHFNIYSIANDERGMVEALEEYPELEKLSTLDLERIRFMVEVDKEKNTTHKALKHLMFRLGRGNVGYIKDLRFSASHARLLVTIKKLSDSRHMPKKEQLEALISLGDISTGARMSEEVLMVLRDELLWHIRNADLEVKASAVNVAFQYGILKGRSTAIIDERRRPKGDIYKASLKVIDKYMDLNSDDIKRISLNALEIPLRMTHADSEQRTMDISTMTPSSSIPRNMYWEYVYTGEEERSRFMKRVDSLTPGFRDHVLDKMKELYPKSEVVSIIVFGSYLYPLVENAVPSDLDLAVVLDGETTKKELWEQKTYLFKAPVPEGVFDEEWKTDGHIVGVMDVTPIDLKDFMDPRAKDPQGEFWLTYTNRFATGIPIYLRDGPDADPYRYMPPQSNVFVKSLELMAVGVDKYIEKLQKKPAIGCSKLLKRYLEGMLLLHLIDDNILEDNFSKKYKNLFNKYLSDMQISEEERGGFVEEFFDLFTEDARRIIKWAEEIAVEKGASREDADKFIYSIKARVRDLSFAFDIEVPFDFTSDRLNNSFTEEIIQVSSHPGSWFKSRKWIRDTAWWAETWIPASLGIASGAAAIMMGFSVLAPLIGLFATAFVFWAPHLAFNMEDAFSGNVGKLMVITSAVTSLGLVPLAIAPGIVPMILTALVVVSISLPVMYLHKDINLKALKAQVLRISSLDEAEEKIKRANNGARDVENKLDAGQEVPGVITETLYKATRGIVAELDKAYIVISKMEEGRTVNTAALRQRFLGLQEDLVSVQNRISEASSRAGILKYQNSLEAAKREEAESMDEFKEIDAYVDSINEEYGVTVIRGFIIKGDSPLYSITFDNKTWATVPLSEVTPQIERFLKNNAVRLAKLKEEAVAKKAQEERAPSEAEIIGEGGKVAVVGAELEESEISKIRTVKGTVEGIVLDAAEDEVIVAGAPTAFAVPTRLEEIKSEVRQRAQEAVDKAARSVLEVSEMEKEVPAMPAAPVTGENFIGRPAESRRDIPIEIAQDSQMKVAGELLGRRGSIIGVEEADVLAVVVLNDEGRMEDPTTAASINMTGAKEAARRLVSGKKNAKIVYVNTIEKAAAMLEDKDGKRTSSNTIFFIEKNMGKDVLMGDELNAFEGLKKKAFIWNLNIPKESICSVTPLGFLMFTLKFNDFLSRIERGETDLDMRPLAEIMLVNMGEEVNDENIEGVINNILMKIAETGNITEALKLSGKFTWNLPKIEPENWTKVDEYFSALKQVYRSL